MLAYLHVTEADKMALRGQKRILIVGDFFMLCVIGPQ